MIVGCLYPGHRGEEIILHKMQRLNKEFLVGYTQQLTKQLQFVRVYVPLTNFHFSQGTTGNITAPGLQLGCQLILG